MTTSRAAFVEHLLYTTPEWSRWDQDLPALIERLKAFVENIGDVCLPRDARGRGLPYDPDRREDALARTRAIWLLDRLLPSDAGAYFEGLLGADNWDLATHAWARRLGARRDEMLTRAKVPGDLSDESLLASAWVQTCEQADPDELLRFYTLGMACNRALLDSDGQADTEAVLPWAVKPYRAYVRRVADPKRRYEALLPWARVRRSRAVGVLLQDVARRLGPTEDPLPEPEAGVGWMLAELRPRFGDLARVLEDPACGPAEYVCFWAWRHDTTGWERLLETSLEPHLHPAVTDHLAEIVPPDRIDAWRGLLWEADARALQAFCRWLDPRYAAALLPYARDRSAEFAQIAWRCWLHDTPLPVLRAMDTDDLPRWQALDVDRFLHAPASVRFPRVFATRQDFTWDPAARDPFSR